MLIAAITALAICAPAARAQAKPPDDESKSLDLASARPVVEIDAQGMIVVEIDGKKVGVVIAGVSAPKDPVWREQLVRFLNRRLLKDEDVVLEDAIAPPSDDEAPRSAYLFRAPDGLFVNAEVVRLGYAKADLDRDSPHYRVLRDGQRRARRAELGVWGPKPAPTVSSDEREERETEVETGGTVVYVTRTGKKYHRAGCRHLLKSQRPMSLKEAIEKGYEPCKVCKPPTQ